MYIGDIQTFTGTITKTILDNGDWLLEGSYGGAPFSQTLTVTAPCAIIWSPVTSGFMIFPFSKENGIGIPEILEIKLI